MDTVNFLINTRVTTMKYDKKQRDIITELTKGKVVESLEYEEDGEYWVMTFTDGVETSFKFMSELV